MPRPSEHFARHALERGSLNTPTWRVSKPDICMSTHKENRFIREVETAMRDNPDIDMINEWQKIAEMLEKIPSLPTKEEEKKQPRLQPLPLNLFSRKAPSIPDF